MYEITVPSVFGEFLQHEISGYIDELSEKYEDNLSALVTLAEREYRFACYQGASFFKLCIEAGVMLDNAYTRKSASPEGYARENGHAWTFYNYLGEIPADYIEGTPFIENPSTCDLLEAIAIYWYGKAATHFSDQNIEECFIFLHEAYEARDLSSSNALMRLVREDGEKERSSMARLAAEERLKRDPRQKEKLFISSCWQKWQSDPDRYPSKAAFAKDMLTKCEHLVSYKKIEDWCREWEKPNPAS